MSKFKGQVDYTEKETNGMDILNPAPRSVVCIDTTQNYWGITDDNESLTFRAIYHIERLEVHSYHTRVFLREFPGKCFNSVRFAEIR